MTLEIRQFPCLNDNYGYLVLDQDSRQIAAIDTPDADAILAELDKAGWDHLDLVLNTHWHPDHTGGNERLKAETGCKIIGPEEVRRAAPLDQVVGEGSRIWLGETAFDVVAVPGHTLGHVAFHAKADRVAFVGDVIFALGCGRLFEGTPEQMWDSLSRIAQWDDETLLYCAHEYTASNARFALSLLKGLADDPALKAHCDEIFAKRERGEWTVPTTVGVEKRFNPFLTADDAKTFAVRRAGKDSFAG
ncbi:hydroxyacylglutathione hydrolase [Brevundimonas sp.]|uniref:hydroxyacylglutathione hydrolase n=1 Tax=Brevundimonas sp. TaxID=1871086 RepID=UPI00289B3768|nr:hydroxyacylglutathione hydrolase [Brevundimonas sp.]